MLIIYQISRVKALLVTIHSIINLIKSSTKHGYNREFNYKS
jgi:hypothetical protein